MPSDTALAGRCKQLNAPAEAVRFGNPVTTDQQAQGARGIVVAHVPHPDEQACEHERFTLLGFAAQLAALRGDDFGGFHDPSTSHGGHVYYVPSSTLTSAEAAPLAIHGVDDLFGGVVPHAFVGSKAISHPLIAPDAAAVPGWNAGFAQQVGDAVLTGYAAFDIADALRAGRLLLPRGPLRLKPARASGGRGQKVVRDAAELQRHLEAMDAAEVQSHGLVLEEHLEQVRTFSVGQARVAGLVASYFGTQRLTHNNAGLEVFGGSDLHLVRGDFDALLALAQAPEMRRAIEQARRYDAAVRDCYPGFFASRSNYDILVGRDAGGASRSAVLEQSWRVGGATGPELAALEAFQREPQRTQLHASCFEVFGDSPEPPPHATVYFRGTDPRVGPLTKYTVVQPDADAR
jgi:hypothetical protein